MIFGFVHCFLYKVFDRRISFIPNCEQRDIFICKRFKIIPIKAYYSISQHHLVDIHQMMQGQVSTWTEAQVEEKLSELCIEYSAVAILNDALNVKRKSIKLLSDDIANAFEHMKVPGTVIEKMDYAWIPALKAMRDISTTQWSKIELADRENYTGLLRTDAQKVWGFV